MSRTEEIKSFGQDLLQRWKKDDVGTLAAAMAFLAIFSIAPLLVLAVAIAGIVFGEQAAQGELSTQIEEWVGSAGADGVEMIIASAGDPGGGGIVATIVSLALLLFGASKIFTQLQKSLNRIWDVRPDPDQGIRGLIRRRAAGFLMVLSIGILLMGLIVLSTILGNLESFVDDVPAGDTVWMVLNFAVQVALLTFIFGAIFKFVPDVKLRWADVWQGGLLSAILFVIGQFVLSFYLYQASVASSYGAAGSVVVLLLWIYYSTQILFLGAEFTRVYSSYKGRNIQPSKHAIPEEEFLSGGEQPA